MVCRDNNAALALTPVLAGTDGLTTITNSVLQIIATGAMSPT
jgi:hypothetical protein